jgi:hypothetical protein
VEEGDEKEGGGIMNSMSEGKKSKFEEGKFEAARGSKI